MPMKATHQAAGGPLMVAVYAAAETFAFPAPPLPVHLLLTITVWGVTSWNDWDLDYYKDRLHPAFLARWSARWMYRIQTKNDALARHKLTLDDLHRGPTHSFEWCVLVGVVFYLLAALSVLLTPWALWFGIAAFVGTASHVLLDWMTPSGVPFSITYNYLAWSVSLRWYEVNERVKLPYLVWGGERREDRKVWRRHAAAWWIPFYDVSWWLRWIRLPRPILADASRPGCEAGLFHTNSGAEHLWVVPALYACSIVPLLHTVGVLGPVASFMLPWLFA
jgi:hypothetical protein